MHRTNDLQTPYFACCMACGDVYVNTTGITTYEYSALVLDISIRKILELIGVFYKLINAWT